jgi:hypothetical protein
LRVLEYFYDKKDAKFDYNLRTGGMGQPVVWHTYLGEGLAKHVKLMGEKLGTGKRKIA